MNEADHLSAIQISGYLDHGLSAGIRDSIDQHLDRCDQCRAELADAARLADSWTPAATDIERRGKRRWMKAGIPAVIAAAALLTFVFNPQSTRKPQAASAERGAEFGEGRAALQGLSPRSNSVIRAHPLVFMWRNSPAAIYRFTLLTQSGEPLFFIDTRDTLVSVPDSVVLTPGRNYFWRVEGTENGVVSSTGAMPFQVK